MHSQCASHQWCTSALPCSDTTECKDCPLQSCSSQQDMIPWQRPFPYPHLWWGRLQWCSMGLRLLPDWAVCLVSCKDLQLMKQSDQWIVFNNILNFYWLPTNSIMVTIRWILGASSQKRQSLSRQVMWTVKVATKLRETTEALVMSNWPRSSNSGWFYHTSPHRMECARSMSGWAQEFAGGNRKKHALGATPTPCGWCWPNCPLSWSWPCSHTIRPC